MDLSQPLVYYVTWRDIPVIKIGASRNLRARIVDLKKLVPSSVGRLRRPIVLVAEPGDFAVEAERHRQFRHLSVGGEHYRDDAELLRHIEGLRETVGWTGVPEDWPVGV